MNIDWHDLIGFLAIAGPIAAATIGITAALTGEGKKK